MSSENTKLFKALKTLWKLQISYVVPGVKWPFSALYLFCYIIEIRVWFNVLILIHMNGTLINPKKLTLKAHNISRIVIPTMEFASELYPCLFLGLRREFVFL